MLETIPSPDTQIKSVESLFEQHLNIPFPENPTQLPNILHLSEKVYDGLIEAVVAQELDDPHHRDGKPKERSQFVGLIDRSGKVSNSPIYVGTEMRTGDAWAELARWFRPLLGHSNKPLVYWHTHTRLADSPILTESDIAQRLGEDRKAIIYLHASPTQITAIFQTKAAYPKHIPISTMKKGFSRYDELTKFYDSQHDSPRLSDLAQLLE